MDAYTKAKEKLAVIFNHAPWLKGLSGAPRAGPIRDCAALTANQPGSINILAFVTI